MGVPQMMYRRRGEGAVGEGVRRSHGVGGGGRAREVACCAGESVRRREDDEGVLTARGRRQMGWRAHAVSER